MMNEEVKILEDDEIPDACHNYTIWIKGSKTWEESGRVNATFYAKNHVKATKKAADWMKENLPDEQYSVRRRYNDNFRHD